MLANPLAATALALHLRGSDGRSVTEGLVAESVTYSLLQGGPEFARWLASRRDRSMSDSSKASDAASSSNSANSSDSVEDAVLIDRSGDSLLIELNRPERHNAFSRAMRDALGRCTYPSAWSTTRFTRVEVSGRGRSFCSSAAGDLAEFGTFASPVESHLTRLTRSPARLLTHLADRTTVAPSWRVLRSGHRAVGLCR